ncbi:hypothetical protein ALP29_200645 [Pseudomonas syringae pv. avii]|uniref:Uncharacterized protein n=1 Tax=Pseudomonas syringae pv. avii TaxID=663959 RepID=A0A3M5VHZ5_PSESX|nr:hypothetical protein ALP29_200645 [Pseudomonas syringae pv. avii]
MQVINSAPPAKGSATSPVENSARPNAAPAVTPNKDGEARRLRVMPCIKAPATPRHAPTNAAHKARGTRSCATIYAILPPSRPCVNSPFQASIWRMLNDDKANSDTQNSPRQVAAITPAISQRRI